MGQPRTESFPPEVVEHLKCYVYRLIDPRNGETFYVGKGSGDRVFAHVRGAAEVKDDFPTQHEPSLIEAKLGGGPLWFS